MYSSCTINTPLGILVAIASDTHLLAIRFADSKHLAKKTHTFDCIKIKNEILHRTTTQLDEYFAGTRKTFDIPLAPHGTEFQKQAWQALQKIPYGMTRSYSEQAILAGNPRAVRAVGGANNKNPIIIIIPCHRIIGSDGNLVGYAGGLDRKKWLLGHEKK